MSPCPNLHRPSPAQLRPNRARGCGAGSRRTPRDRSHAVRSQRGKAAAQCLKPRPTLSDAWAWQHSWTACQRPAASAGVDFAPCHREHPSLECQQGQDRELLLDPAPAAATLGHAKVASVEWTPAEDGLPGSGEYGPPKRPDSGVLLCQPWTAEVAHVCGHLEQGLHSLSGSGSGLTSESELGHSPHTGGWT